MAVDVLAGDEEWFVEEARKAGVTHPRINPALDAAAKASSPMKY
ncbi:hypothetical protein [Polaromonas sp. UBA4122]|nr:hypothetical protein [Polaromonas sp. UBA4122]